MTMSHELGLIGAGNMAEAIVRAAIRSNVLRPEQMIASDPSEARRAVFRQLGIAVADDNGRVLEASRQVLLAVKPQTFAAVAPSLARFPGVIISIMAGLSTLKLEEAIGAAKRLVRVMPNTPMLVGRGMAGVAPGLHAQPGDESLALRLFRAGGEAIVVEEAAIDAITAVSGSGPAYVFYLAEAMERAAAELGLDEHARLLVRQTIRGAAELLAESSETSAELRRRVTSPGGTTEAAIRHLDQRAVGDAFVAAIAAAQRRAVELGR